MNWHKSARDVRFDRWLLVVALFFLFGAGCGDEAPTVKTSTNNDTTEDAGVIDDVSEPLDTSDEITCGESETLCGSTCVDVTVSAAHCGGCQIACAGGEVCAGGSCAVACPGGQDVCGGGCFDLASDSNHCGECDLSCGAGEVCSAGTCSVSCGAGFTECGGVCRDTAVDPANCGTCDNSCGAGVVCHQGECQAGGCPSPLTDCEGACFDLDSDRRHCGGCNVSCGDGEICDGGVCQLSCGGGLFECDGVCRDLERDSDNCGACGVSCEAGLRCVAESCQVTCGGGLIECDGLCRDLQTDRNNCGSCANQCGQGEVCDAGSCALSCAPGLSTCDDTCRDLQNDSTNCGSCGTTCPQGQVCANGDCSLTCAGGLDACDGACRDLSSDTNFCGSCGTSCAPGEVCDDGSCAVVCAGTLQLCDSSCVNTTNDPSHCGGCANSCPDRANAASVCALGDCAFVCDSGWSNCDGNADTGCERWGSCNFRYQRTVTLTNSGSLAGDYRARIDFDTALPISENKMRSDCGDLRFYDADGALLDYWIEDGCNTAATLIWVKVPSVANGTHSIEMHYGNPTGADASAEPDVVFDLFDGFSQDTSDDYTLHTAWAGGYLWLTNLGILRTDTSNADFYLIHDATASAQNFVVETRAFMRDNDGVAATLWTSDDRYYSCVAVGGDYDGTAQSQGNRGTLIIHNGLPTAGYQASQLVSFPTFASPRNRWTSIGLGYDGRFLTCYFDGVRQAQVFDLGTVTVSGVGIGSLANNPAADHLWFRLRPQENDDITIAIGSEDARFAD